MCLSIYSCWAELAILKLCYNVSSSYSILLLFKGIWCYPTDWYYYIGTTLTFSWLYILFISFSKCIYFPIFSAYFLFILWVWPYLLGRFFSLFHLAGYIWPTCSNISLMVVYICICIISIIAQYYIYEVELNTLISI